MEASGSLHAPATLLRRKVKIGSWNYLRSLIIIIVNKGKVNSKEFICKKKLIAEERKFVRHCFIIHFPSKVTKLIQDLFELCYIERFFYIFPFYRALKKGSTMSVVATFIESFSDLILFSLPPCLPPSSLFLSWQRFRRHSYRENRGRRGRKTIKRLILFEDVRLASELWKPISFLTFSLHWFPNTVFLASALLYVL